MLTSINITRHDPSEDPLSFASLRKSGIDYAQHFSGSVWTDYNAHDPGVTILEQLCYGLTELRYRSDFDVADHLAEQDGYLNLKQLALCPPEDILPARVCNIEDYRNLLLDSIEEIDRVWISQQSGIYRGLYQIQLQLTPQMRARCLSRPALGEKIIDKVSLIYGKNRNLCENIGDINIVKDKGYQLVASIDLLGDVNAEAVLAEIYDVCHQWLVGQLIVESYESQIKAGESLDSILTGPKTVHGRYHTHHLQHNPLARTISSLYSHVRLIKGIDAINHLSLVDGDKMVSESMFNHTDPQISHMDIRDKAWLNMPVCEAEMNVLVHRHQQRVAINFDSFNAYLEHRQFKQYSVRHTRQDISSLYQPIEGTCRQQKQYYSVQYHFPVHYNLSVMGAQFSSSLTEKAKANQLKGYLLIFDQLLANFSENINHIKNLFSIDTQVNKTYQFYHFDSISLQGIEQFYPKERQKVATALVKFDDFNERKGRVLDYLLALYGEEFQQTILRQFNPYQSKLGIETEILDNKYQYLSTIVSLGRDRGGGFDYRSYRLFETNVGGFQYRLSCKLGMQLHKWPYTSMIKRAPLNIVPDSDFAQKNTAHHNQVILNDAMEKQLMAIPLIESDLGVSPEKISKIILSLLPLKQQMIGESFFQKGVNINHYKLVKRQRSDVYDLFFTEQECKDLFAEQLAAQSCQTVYIGSSLHLDKINRLANMLRRYLVDINRSCEGVYVVEHLLLKPTDERPQKPSKNEQQLGDDFYSFQISVVFAGFTGRCVDKGYRKRAEEIVHEQCPAHIFPQCYWLSFSELCQFEHAYMQWLELRRASYIANEKCQASAAILVKLLRQYRLASAGEAHD